MQKCDNKRVWKQKMKFSETKAIMSYVNFDHKK